MDMQVGSLTITPLRDGEFHAGPDYFGTDASFAGHEALLSDDGKMHLPIGCFLLRGGPLGSSTVLVDAGLGEMSAPGVSGGALLDELERAGVRPGDIDSVICSHLHIDHCGWLVDNEARPIFTNASISAGSGDWARFVDGTDLMQDHTRAGLRELASKDRVRLIDQDVVVAPGVTAVLAPGHTPGHLILVIADGDQRALLLGDAICCPVQLEELDWAAMSDVDPELARRTRERLWRELEETGSPAVGAHFPELRFGRVLAGESRRRWTGVAAA
jgi:glyoxylase-like metal-dependent hydrolase (beta-lactamase superfamily II)